MTPEYIILHTAAFRGDAPPEEIDRWHSERKPPFRRARTRTGPLRHIGYHWYIERSGVLTAGRDEDEVGAHCIEGGMNNKSLGICLEGHGDFEPWTEAQFGTLVTLLRDIRTRHPRIAVRGTAALIGHREAGAPKTCPGNLIDMDGVRRWYDRLVVAHGVKPIAAMPLEPMPDR